MNTPADFSEFKTMVEQEFLDIQAEAEKFKYIAERNKEYLDKFEIDLQMPEDKKLNYWVSALEDFSERQSNLNVIWEKLQKKHHDFLNWVDENIKKFKGSEEGPKQISNWEAEKFQTFKSQLNVSLNTNAGVKEYYDANWSSLKSSLEKRTSQLKSRFNSIA